eukprot:3840293-Pyramimonas_sp.AAC.1
MRHLGGREKHMHMYNLSTACGRRGQDYVRVHLRDPVLCHDAVRVAVRRWIKYYIASLHKHKHIVVIARLTMTTTAA